MSTARLTLPALAAAGTRYVVALIALGSCSLHGATPNPFGERTRPVVAGVSNDDLVVEPVVLKTLPKKTFKVRHVGEIGQPKREALAALFTVFQSQYALDDAGQIIAAAPWTGTGLATLSTTIQQDPSDGFYLLGSRPANFVMLTLDDARPRAIGTKLKTNVYQAGEQTWLAPDGTPQKSPLYRELSLPLKEATPRPPNRDQFVSALRAGQKFELLTKEGDTLVVQIAEW